MLEVLSGILHFKLRRLSSYVFPIGAIWENAGEECKKKENILGESEVNQSQGSSMTSVFVPF